MWQCCGEVDPCTQRYWYCQCSCTQETATDGWNWWLLHLCQGMYCYAWQLWYEGIFAFYFFWHLYMNWCKMKRLFEWPLVFCSKSNIRCHCQHLFLLDPWPVEGDCLHQVSIPGVHWLPGQEPHPPARTETGAEGVLSIEIKAYKHCYHCLWIFWINSLTDIF